VEGLRVLDGGDAWAVGFLDSYPLTAVIAHRANGLWIERKEGRGILYSIGANSPSDVWAVGQTKPVGTKGSQPRLLRLDGGRWDALKAPGGLDLVGRRWPWFGASLFSSDQKSLYLPHGGALRAVRLPGGRSSVVAIAGTDSRHVWVADSSWIRAWNGTSWSAIGHLRGDPNTWWAKIDAASGTDVWTLDETLAPTGASMHWDGQSWRLFPYPNHPARTPLGLVAVSANEAWALFDLALLRWNGASWTPETLPRPPPAPPGVHGRFWPAAIDVDAPDSIWLAGYRGTVGTGSKTVSAVFHGTCV
jgi:hypothetical protein